MPDERKLAPDPSPLMVFGFELRRFREAAGLTQDQLGSRIQYTAAMVGYVENAKRTPKEDFATRADEALKAGGVLIRLWALVGQQTSSPRWFQPFLEIEREATVLRTWQPLLVPGLLQTEDYARVVLSTEPGVTATQVDELVSARMERQSVLASDDGPMFWAVIDEGVLNRPLGGPMAIRAQIERLLEASENPRVTVQVVPLTEPSIGLLGGFIVAERDGLPDTVYLETAGDGQIIDNRDMVRVVNTRYEGIRSQALPRDASREVLRKKVAEWT